MEKELDEYVKTTLKHGIFKEDEAKYKKFVTGGLEMMKELKLLKTSFVREDIEANIYKANFNDVNFSYFNELWIIFNLINFDHGVLGFWGFDPKTH